LDKSVLSRAVAAHGAGSIASTRPNADRPCGRVALPIRPDWRRRRSQPHRSSEGEHRRMDCRGECSNACRSRVRRLRHIDEITVAVKGKTAGPFPLQPPSRRFSRQRRTRRLPSGCGSPGRRSFHNAFNSPINRWRSPVSVVRTMPSRLRNPGADVSVIARRYIREGQTRALGRRAMATFW
jgi:hypothetical protein